MKHYLAFVLLFGAACRLGAQDLPLPTPNLQTLPKGSYIIATDNTNQLNGTLFNLKAYGLVTYLLNNGAQLKWIITSGKVKDQADISVKTTQVRPTVNNTAINRSFSGGPFVIFASDTTGVAALIDGFYSSAALTGTARPNVFVSRANVTVDVRYDMSGFIPYAAILDDGANAKIHTAFMTAASVPASNYYTSLGTTFRTSCATFASEPHNNSTSIGRTDSIVQTLRAFTEAGGNFLAQCAAVPFYENSTYGYFQSSAGMTTTNLAIGTADSFPNADLSFSQLVGPLSASQGGSVLNWKFNGSGVNSVHGHVFGLDTNNYAMSASVSKLYPGTGGLVFYLGSHNYNTKDQQNINGIRMYLNAFLTPAQMVCMGVLPVGLESFEGVEGNGTTKLKWVVAQNEDCSSFDVEWSRDGKNFQSLFTRAATQLKGRAAYEEPVSPVGMASFYRLKIVALNGTATYSRTLRFLEPEPQAPKLILQGNPVHDQLSFLLPVTSGPGKYKVSLYNAQGARIFETFLSLPGGSGSVQIPLRHNIPSGILMLEVRTEQQIFRTKLLKE